MPKKKNVLRVVDCLETGWYAVYFNGKLVYNHDHDPEALYRLADHLGWEIQHESLTYQEYQDRYA